MVRRISLMLAMLAFGMNIVLAEELREASRFFHDSFGDLQEEAQTAVDEGKTGVLIMFEDKDCPWCRRMKQSILNRATVQDLFHQHFRIISIDVNGDTTITSFDGEEVFEREFALKYNRVRATPVFAFFDGNGKFLTRFTGAAKSVKEFMLLAEFVVDGHYQSSRFSKFRRQRMAKSG